MSEARAVILDCDTGTDDAVAIMLAALDPGLDLLGVSAVWGNHDVATTADNALRVLDHIDRHDVPVARGLGAAEARHGGAQGGGGGGHTADAALPLPASVRPVARDGAVEWLVEILRSERRPVTLVATGPLTNVAAALTAEPALTELVAELVVMGGSHGVTTANGAETNMRNDPDAAAAVLAAGFPRLVLMPLDATYRSALSVTDCNEIDALGTPAASATATFVRQRIARYASVPSMARASAAPVHDALAVAYLIEPSVVTLRPAYVTVDLGGQTPGRTQMVFDPDHREPNALVAVDADRQRFLEVLRRTFRNPNRLRGRSGDDV